LFRSKHPVLFAVTIELMCVPLAYRHVATAVMVMEINYCAERLNLLLPKQVSEKTVKGRIIDSPYTARDTIGPFFGGRLDVGQYSMSFAHDGVLCYISDLSHPWNAMRREEFADIQAYMSSMSGKPCRINTNDAYDLAMSWLQAIDIDVNRLNSDHSVAIEQFRPNGLNPIPIFEVHWNHDVDYGRGRVFNMPVVSVLIDGETRSLIHLRQEDVSYSRRPRKWIKNVEALMGICDEEFLSYRAFT
jgi:hypothetical protein